MVRKADTLPKPQLTEEEKAARMQAIKDRVKQRREEKERIEKAEAIKREKERRERDQKMAETQEERQRMLRKREAERQAREKKVGIDYILYIYSTDENILDIYHALSACV